MSIKFITSTPNNLLSTFKKAIDNKEVVTWAYDGAGDFTHVTESNQWKNKAWLRPKIETGQLVFGIVKSKSVTLTYEIYSVYHGRFIESMISHCNKLFTSGTATASPTNDDIV